MDAACARIPIARSDVGDDGLIHDDRIRGEIAAVVGALGGHRACLVAPRRIFPRVARQAADESITLLRNKNNVLPLSPGIGKLVVTGPNADSLIGQLGGWSVSWQGIFGGGQACCAGPPDQIPPATTVLQGIKAAVSPSTQVLAAPDQASAVSALMR